MADTLSQALGRLGYSHRQADTPTGDSHWIIGLKGEIGPYTAHEGWSWIVLEKIRRAAPPALQAWIDAQDERRLVYVITRAREAAWDREDAAREEYNGA